MSGPTDPAATPLLIYIAGPYRAPTTWEIHQNIHNARAWGAVVAKHGAYPIIPHSNTAHMDGAADDKLWLAGTLELMRRCDAAIFINGWQNSKGSLIEHKTAKELHIPVLDVSAWENRGGANISAAMTVWLLSINARTPPHDTEGP